MSIYYIVNMTSVGMYKLNRIERRRKKKQNQFILFLEKKMALKKLIRQCVVPTFLQIVRIIDE